MSRSYHFMPGFGRKFKSAPAPKPKPPVTEFKRPRAESFTVSGTGGWPSVYITAKAHGKMLALVKNCDIEIAWMASVHRDDDNDFVIRDVYVPLQECGAASTDISEDGDAELMMELLGQGLASEVNALRCWGHSHVDMAVNPSGTDDDTTQKFIDNLSEVGSDHFIRLIGNKRGDLMCHVYLMDQGVTLNNPPIHVRKDDVDYTDWALEQIATKVTRITYTYPYGGSYTGGWYGGESYTRPKNPNSGITDWFDQLEADEKDALYDDIQEYAEFFDDPLFDEEEEGEFNRNFRG